MVVYMRKEIIDNMDRNTFERVMDHIVHSIEAAGYDARNQIKAYLITSDEKYITRHGRARDYIQRLDKTQIEKYLRRYL